MKKTSFTILIILAVLIISLHTLFSSKKELTKLNWVSLNKTPHFDEGCSPQGMTFLNDFLLLAVSCHENVTYIYNIDENNGNSEYLFSMPSEASHTSGLTHDGTYLWACDYNSDKIYKIDLKKSINKKEAVVIDSYDSGLKGLSSCTYFEYEGKDYLLMSDFRNTKKNYLIAVSKIDKDGIQNSIEYSYKNKGFSQGLAIDGNVVYESNSELGNDIIYSLSLADLFQNKSVEIIDIFSAPHRAVEDLAIQDGIIYTSDESSFEAYKTKTSVYGGS